MRRRYRGRGKAHTANTTSAPITLSDHRPVKVQRDRPPPDWKPPPAKHARRRASVVAALIAAASAVAVLSFFARGWWSQVKPVRVTANLTQIGPVSLTPSSQSDGGISPVCGCLLNKVNRWRGITFAGREIALRRQGKAPFTEWLVSGASLRPVELDTGETRMTVDIYWFDSKKFNPAWVLAGVRTLKQHAKNVNHVRIRAHTLKILTAGPLNIDMAGSVPVGDWIPLPGSNVHLSSVSSPFLSSAPSLRLVEHYPRRLGFQSSDSVVSRQGYPLGDFLGPNLVLWSRDEMPFATDLFELGHDRKSPSSIHAAMPLAFAGLKGQIYAAVIRGSGFSTRIAAVPVQPNDISFLLDNLSEASTRQEQIDGFHWGGGDGGSVTLTVQRPLTPTAYAAMRAAVDAHPDRRVRYWRDMTLTPDPTFKRQSNSHLFSFIERSVDIPESGTDERGHVFQVDLLPPLGASTSYNRGFVTEDDRYPPLPPNAGFNVFGPIDDLELDSTVGAIAVGGNQISLETPHSLRLQGLSDFQSVGTAQTVVSVPMATANGSADLEFSAVAKVSIDGRAYSTAAQRNAHRVRVMIDLVGLISGLIAIIAALGPLRRRLRPRETV